MADSMTKPEIPKDIQGMSFEQALAALEEIVARLESGKGKLDEAITSYERGAALKRHCEAKLREARSKVSRIQLGDEGPAGLEDVDIE
ncbi:MAG: exodeoxyribonuclease VII small subunit [Alphaproteobacteria bacterium]|nr:exodeoxyribonuclease VII small subunit [Alphaproteobacteria bacterium]